MPNLVTFGATEYMDGAMTLPVLRELLLRGTPSRGRGRPSRGRELTNPDSNDVEEHERERRRECKDLEALDLTGCISAVFVTALVEFVNNHLLVAPDSDSSDSDDDGRRSGRRARFARVQEESLLLPGLQRLGLRGVRSIQPQTLTPFVLAFPSLTHLDLSATRVTPELLYALGASQTVRLTSLALARCVMLTGKSIRDFLVEAPAAENISELTLYGDRTFPSPLSQQDLHDIFSLAPSFTSGEMLYLDLSSAPVTPEILCTACKSMPKLRSLGLSYIPDLQLDTVADFVLSKAPNVEILTLLGTSPELELRSSARQASMAIHSKLIRVLCALPPSSTNIATPPSRVRVIEVSIPVLATLGAGAGSWRVIRSKGGRGWYVDTASGWVNGELKRTLAVDHPLRRSLEHLAELNGNVNSGVGWHARKMEVCFSFIAWIWVNKLTCYSNFVA